MDTQVTLSIIVPMYNPELAGLERCFLSISSIRQKLEVILIDDGSVDEKVKEFCDSYIRKDGRYKYYYQKNGGVSAARNLGLTKAKGKYVSFIDADDLIDGAVLNHLDFSTLETAELILFDIYEVDPAGNKKRRELFPQETGFISKEEVIKNFITTSKLYECWGKLFRADLIKKKLISFPYTIKQGEDVIFNCRYFQYITKVYYCKEILYHYNYSRNNTTQRFINNPLARLNDVFINYKFLLTLIETTFEDREQKKYKKILDNDYTCGFGSRLILLSKYRLVDRDVKKFIRFEVKPLLLKKRRYIFIKKPKAWIFDLIIRNNLWFTFHILQHFKRVEI